VLPYKIRNSLRKNVNPFLFEWPKGHWSSGWGAKGYSRALAIDARAQVARRRWHCVRWSKQVGHLSQLMPTVTASREVGSTVA